MTMMMIMHSVLHTLFFIEVKFTYYKINHFKVYNLEAFNPFTTLCNHHLFLVPKHFILAKGNHYPLGSYSPFSPPPPPAPDNFLSAFCLLNLANLVILYKWNHTIGDLLCLASFFLRFIHFVAPISTSFFSMADALIS